MHSPNSIYVPLPIPLSTVAVPVLHVLLMAQSIMIGTGDRPVESVRSVKSVLGPVACDFGFKAYDQFYVVQVQLDSVTPTHSASPSSPTPGSLEKVRSE